MAWIMYCKTCHYCLAGLSQHRCPECAQAFDPLDSSTFEASPRPRPRWWRRLLLAVSLYPLMVLILLYATWGAAAISLGHVPIPSLDDPKYINVVVTALHHLTLVGLLFGWIP